MIYLSSLKQKPINIHWLLLAAGVSFLLLKQCDPILGYTSSSTLSSLLPITSKPVRLRTTTTRLSAAAKRRKNDKLQQDNAWYEEIDQDATPDEIFWSEMERQKAMASPTVSSTTTSSTLSSVAESTGSTSSSSLDDLLSVGAVASMKINPLLASSSAMGGSGGIGGKGLLSSSSSSSSHPLSLNEERATEKTLAIYAPFLVENNWLNEEYGQMMLLEDVDIEQQDDDIEKQFAEWERDMGASGGGAGAARGAGAGDGRIEPWDRWNAAMDDHVGKGGIDFGGGGDDSHDHIVDYDDDDDGDVQGRISKSDIQNKAKSELAKEFLLNPNLTGDSLDLELERSQEDDEAQHLQKLSEIRLKCKSLDKASGNPRAHAFFSRPPNEIEGFDRMWVSAIDDACFRNLVGSFRNYGVEFACNFGEWEDGCDNDAFQSIEDLASYKARKVYEVTGLPAIASRTSFEVEPARVPDRSTPMNRMLQNTRVTSGYRFNSVGDHVDYLIEALKPYSEPTRVTRFRSCFCFYDGEIEIFDYGELDCDIYFANSARTFIPMSCGIDGIGKTLQLAFGLDFQGWLRKKVRDAMHRNESRVSKQLRDRILKEGKVLPNNIVDVSAFMDSMVDVNLMDDCAKELSKRFESLKPTKILTVATTGLVLAIPMAKYLQVPVVYARKERNIVMSDTYKANYSSKTVGKNRELMVSKKHIHPDDRILIVDDFLSSGASQEALLRIVSDAEASAVGVGVLLEKVYDAGRQFLSGFNIPVESIAKIASVKDGIIAMEEEEGYASSPR
mmetsp:Transcript_3887/g.7472  ORF Transcript_3887/g.7472 Transcript_3887/m.7472 type:complete len:785 (-) Transcript_3887:63-2417(-)